MPLSYRWFFFVFLQSGLTTTLNLSVTENIYCTLQEDAPDSFSYLQCIKFVYILRLKSLVVKRKAESTTHEGVLSHTGL